MKNQVRELYLSIPIENPLNVPISKEVLIKACIPVVNDYIFRVSERYRVHMDLMDEIDV